MPLRNTQRGIQKFTSVLFGGLQIGCLKCHDILFNIHVSTTSMLLNIFLTCLGKLFGVDCMNVIHFYSMINL